MYQYVRPSANACLLIRETVWYSQTVTLFPQTRTYKPLMIGFITNFLECVPVKSTFNNWSITEIDDQLTAASRLHVSKLKDKILD